MVTGRISDDALDFAGNEIGTFGTTNIGGELTFSIWINLSASIINYRGVFNF